MDIKNSVNAARLLYEGMIKGKTNFAQIPCTPGKTVLGTEEKSAFSSASPEWMGLSGKAVLSLARALSSEKDANVHTCLLLCGGKRVFEGSAEGYSARMPHATFSLAKTVVGLAIGMLIEDGRLSLDDKVVSFFPDQLPKLLSKRTRALTVKHLLTMSSGIVFNEAGAVVEENWIRSFFESAVRFAPGSRFAYNSMNSYMLAAIVTRLTGRSLSDFLRERLWDPLGVENAFWELCPRGIEKGGWGLYLSPESMAKLGLLLLRGGVYGGRRILSEEWVKEMTAAQISVPDAVGPYHYGYHVWVHKTDGSFLLNGMLGQNTRVDPRTDTVLTVTAGDTCVFQDAYSMLAALPILEKMEKGRRRLPSLRIQRALKKEAAHFGEEGGWLSPRGERHERAREAAREEQLAAQGLYRTHYVSENNTGILPFITRLIQNNHSAGLSALTLSKDGEVLVLTFKEGKELYTVRAGWHKMLHGTLNVRGERYRACAAYEISMDEHRLPVLKIQLSYPELAGTQCFTVRAVKDGFALHVFERPGFSFVERLVDSASVLAGEENGMIDFVTSKINIESLMARMKKTLAPTLALSQKPLPHHAEGSEEDGELSAFLRAVEQAEKKK
jgi:CubicO group peptidase (beta-lactamase class C family)